MSKYPFNKTAEALGALIGWFAVILQFVLMLQNSVFDVPETIIRFFSYFTILTNIIVALSFSISFFSQAAAKNEFWNRSSTKTAILVYIIVVGIIYNLILRQLWAPVGLQKLVDELLHLFIPLYYLVYWILFVSRQELQWKFVWSWLWYPFIYLVFILIRGAISNTNFYPYPFVDVYNHGYEKVMMSAGFVLLLFVILSLAFIAINKWMLKKDTN